MRRFNALRRALLVLCGGGALALMLVVAPLAAASGTAYTPETPVVDTISGGPWNTSQGDSSAGSEYPSSDLLPTFSFGGPETTLGGVSEPNLAVYPGEQKVIENGKEVTSCFPTRAASRGLPGRSTATALASAPTPRPARPSPSPPVASFRSRPTTSPTSSEMRTAR